MPRYRYKEASFSFPAIKHAWIKVPTITTGILILEAIGEGSLMLTAGPVRTPRFLICPGPRIAIDQLRDIDQPAIFRLFDRESDIELGRQEHCTTLHTSHFPSDLLKRLKPDAQHRLRHFAALVTSGIRIGDWNLWSPIERAAMDAGLNIEERQIGYQFEKEKRLSELLADPYPFSDS